MTIDIAKPIGEITVAFPRASRVFERFGIDYCCQGRRTLPEACAARGLALPDVLHALEAEGEELKPSAAPVGQPLELIDYIERKHHDFTRSELARLAPLAHKVMRVHARTHPEVVKVHALLAELTDELEPHMIKEERVLFPHLRCLLTQQVSPISFPNLDVPISVMHHDHEHMGRLLEELAAATRDYSPPADACASYRALYDGLAALQADLHVHVHLENHVLFPAAQALEAQRKCAARDGSSH